ncbi:copper chaperone PCu(A)C [Streptosporangiaceae bacterium NEAU-GS5]|nr:copper chaperone PCu(A)C [Streptosporangiaceae bacterium NEAU-GS5]
MAACASGFDANTNKPYVPSEPNVLITDGTYGHNGIYIPQVFILGPDPGGTIPAGGRASLYLSVVNNNAQADQLIAVAPAGQQVTSVEGAEPIAVPPGTLVNMGKPSPKLTVTGLKQPLRGGESIPLTFKFQNAGDISITVPVITRNREYATLPPASEPAPTPTATATLTPSASPSAEAPSPTPTPTS